MDGMAEKRIAEAALLDELASELERYERILTMSDALLSPILIPRADSPETSPQEAPQHEMHSLILRLRQLNHSNEEMRSRIRL